MKHRVSLRKKSVFFVISIALILSTAAVVFSFLTYKETMDDHFEYLATADAQAAANTIDIDEVVILRDEIVAMYDSISDDAKVSSVDLGTAECDEYLSNFSDIQASNEWNEVHEQLEAVRSATDIISVYLLYPHEGDRTAIYLSDSSSDEICLPGTFDHLSDAQCAVFDDPYKGFEPYITNYPEYGHLMTTAVPVFDESGEFVCLAFADVSMQDVINDRNSYLRFIIIFLGILTIVLCMTFIGVVNYLIVEPINKIAVASKNYISGENEKDSTLFEKLNIHSGDEIENLSQTMTQMAIDIDHYINAVTAATAEQERMGAELDLAKSIQASYLPSIFPPFPNRTEFDLYASMEPAKEVGGDFYDFFLIDEDHLALVMADVSGKGVPAALFMMISKTLIKNQTAYSSSPSEILRVVNNQLCENNVAEMFVTVWLGILNVKTGELVTSSAGHEYPAIRREGGEFELFRDKHGMPLGGLPGIKFKEEVLKLNPNDELYVYTDGVPEATNADNKLYGTDRMIKALNSSDVGDDLEMLLKNVRADIDSFVDGAPQFDDITMLVIKYFGE